VFLFDSHKLGIVSTRSVLDSEERSSPHLSCVANTGITRGLYMRKFRKGTSGYRSVSQVLMGPVLTEVTLKFDLCSCLIPTKLGMCLRGLYSIGRSAYPRTYVASPTQVLLVACMTPRAHSR
jgi:hypothetical protein